MISAERKRQLAIGSCLAQLLKPIDTLENVGKELGIPWQRVQQIEAEALYKIFARVRTWMKSRERNGGDRAANWRPSEAVLDRACPIELQRGPVLMARLKAFAQVVDLGKYLIPSPPENNMITKAELDARRIDTAKEAKALGYVPVTYAFELPAERAALRKVVADLDSPHILIALVGKSNNKLSVWRKDYPSK
jgi:hypothetical protein